MKQEVKYIVIQEVEVLIMLNQEVKYTLLQEVYVLVKRKVKIYSNTQRGKYLKTGSESAVRLKNLQYCKIQEVIMHENRKE